MILDWTLRHLGTSASCHTITSRALVRLTPRSACALYLLPAARSIGWGAGCMVERDKIVNHRKKKKLGKTRPYTERD